MARVAEATKRVQKRPFIPRVMHLIRDLVMAKMEELVPLIPEISTPKEHYNDNGYNALGVHRDDVIKFSMKQFNVRKERLARAKDQSIEEIYRNNAKAYLID